MSFAELASALPYARLVINTVPARVLEQDMLALLRPDALVLDLASKPGGDVAGDGKAVNR